MAELTLAIVGVLPVVLASIEGFKALRNTTKAAKSCVKYLRDIDLDVQVQHERFLRSCTLIFGTIVKEQGFADMVLDVEHPAWSNTKELEEQAKAHLGSAYTTCLRLIDRVKEIVEEAKEELIQNSIIHPFYCSIVSIPFLCFTRYTPHLDGCKVT